MFNNRDGVWGGGCAPLQLKKTPKSDCRPRSTSKEKEHNRLTNHCARCDVTVNNKYDVNISALNVQKQQFFINDSQKANTDEQVHNCMLKLRYVRFLIFIN